ncbi:DUF4160 domain-containing protein [Sandaracinobacteroides saxicola]|uniref:DUF4160 domain-containing protein n=1 Tax=Sandaracinobacteroides saxicola TaxID=2759707 RepID=A0A7G5IJQ2_9SPHN|nr:DUF4160 domain-containing protein [Sandaracinobacteroides saxicola]QMW23594.1 DUF4160 domain-containing protein [Sandaracinobacteroides saxicola]
MPTVLRIGAFRFYFYSHEPNEPPHVHVDRGGATIKIWLDGLDVALNRGFRAHEIGEVVAMVRANRARLTEAWHGFFG